MSQYIRPVLGTILFHVWCDMILIIEMRLDMKSFSFFAREYVGVFAFSAGNTYEKSIHAISLT